MGAYTLSIRPFGIHAVLIEWPPTVSTEILADILQYQRSLSERLNAQDWEVIPAYNSLTLIRKEKAIDFIKFEESLRKWYAQKPGSFEVQRYLWKLPVCYEEDLGVDLLEVSEKLSLSVEELIEKHTQHTYTVFGIGFLPGFMYLGGLPKELEVPRKTAPRQEVVKGAVGLAGKQTGIYPQRSPGGWNIIGNCSVPLFDASKNPPCFVNVGDSVQFVAIERAAYELHKIEAEVGIYTVEKMEWDA